MKNYVTRNLLGISFLVLGGLTAAHSQTQVQSFEAGKKFKVEGTVVAKEDENKFIVRDNTGNQTRVVISSESSIKGGGKKYPATIIVRGLHLQAKGHGDTSDNLEVSKIRFSKVQLEVAQSIDTRVTPDEERLTTAEENQKRQAGQIDEVMAIANTGVSEAKAAQQTADAAIAGVTATVDGVNATNRRISALDGYSVQAEAIMNFRVNSAALSPEAKAVLDELAIDGPSMKGYTIEVVGFASSDGSARRNKILSQRRAQAVIDYLVEKGNIPLQRIGQSYGYGDLEPIADNETREGREVNRSVVVKMLINRGINDNIEVRASKN